MNVDISIIDHPTANVLELIGFHPETEQESRLYVSKPLLWGKLDKAKLAEVAMRAKVDQASSRSILLYSTYQVFQPVMVEYLLGIVNIKCDQTERIFEIFLPAQSQSLAEDLTLHNGVGAGDVPLGTFTTAAIVPVAPAVNELILNQNSIEVPNVIIQRASKFRLAIPNFML